LPPQIFGLATPLRERVFIQHHLQLFSTIESQGVMVDLLSARPVCGPLFLLDPLDVFLTTSQGRTRGLISPLKPPKVTLFTMILFNSKNSIRDERPFYRPLFCYSNVVKDTTSLLQ